jgi:hypothetical protein
VQPFIFVENVASENGVTRTLQSGLAVLHRATGWGTAPDKDTLADLRVRCSYQLRLVAVGWSDVAPESKLGDDLALQASFVGLPISCLQAKSQLHLRRFPT